MDLYGGLELPAWYTNQRTTSKATLTIAVSEKKKKNAKNGTSAAAAAVKKKAPQCSRKGTEALDEESSNTLSQLCRHLSAPPPPLLATFSFIERRKEEDQHQGETKDNNTAGIESLPEAEPRGTQANENPPANPNNVEFLMFGEKEPSASASGVGVVVNGGASTRTLFELEEGQQQGVDQRQHEPAVEQDAEGTLPLDTKQRRERRRWRDIPEVCHTVNDTIASFVEKLFSTETASSLFVKNRKPSASPAAVRGRGGGGGATHKSAQKDFLRHALSALMDSALCFRCNRKGEEKNSGEEEGDADVQEEGEGEARATSSTTLLNGRSTFFELLHLSDQSNHTLSQQQQQQQGVAAASTQGSPMLLVEKVTISPTCPLSVKDIRVPFRPAKAGLALQSGTAPPPAEEEEEGFEVQTHNRREKRDAFRHYHTQPLDLEWYLSNVLFPAYLAELTGLAAATRQGDNHTNNESSRRAQPPPGKHPQQEQVVEAMQSLFDFDKDLPTLMQKRKRKEEQRALRPVTNDEMFCSPPTTSQSHTPPQQQQGTGGRSSTKKVLGQKHRLEEGQPPCFWFRLPCPTCPKQNSNSGFPLSQTNSSNNSSGFLFAVPWSSLLLGGGPSPHPTPPPPAAAAAAAATPCDGIQIDLDLLELLQRLKKRQQGQEDGGGDSVTPRTPQPHPRQSGEGFGGGGGSTITKKRGRFGAVKGSNNRHNGRIHLDISSGQYTLTTAKEEGTGDDPVGEKAETEGGGGGASATARMGEVPAEEQPAQHGTVVPGVLMMGSRNCTMISLVSDDDEEEKEVGLF